MTSYVETVKECIQKMDIEKLRLILKDEYSYQDTSKDVFLEELDGYLECHKSYGETELLMYKGVCGKETCPNKGKGGYRFVGDITGNYMDFIFEEEGDDIKDIYTCEELSCNADCGDLDSRATFYIQLDKRNSFERTLDYELKLQAAMSALDELFNDKVCDMDLDKVKYWLEKHKKTHLKIGEDDPFLPIMKWTAFSALYKEFSNLLEFIDGYGEQIQSAYDKRPDDNEERLIAWIIEHEELYKKIPRELPLSVYFLNTYDGKSKNLELNFTGIEVIKLFAFMDFHTENYNRLFEKYNSLTIKERDDLCNEDIDFACNIFPRLSFHINRRKELAKEGISIPLYLRNESCD
jgi:hypothetical protein